MCYESYQYRLGVEDIEPGSYIAWVLDLPGCYSAAKSQTDAVAQAPGQIAAYYAWIAGHDPSLPEVKSPFKVGIAEAFRAFLSEDDPDYLVNAFFEDDRRPLGYWDVDAGLRLLEWSRQDLFAIVESLPCEQLDRSIPGEVHSSVAGILEHVAGAENWYLGQLDIAPDRSALPGEPLRRLAAVRAHTRAQLVTLIGDERVTCDRGECWSARKLLRRTLWHERAHTRQIERYVARLG